MLVPLSWLKQYVDITLPVGQLAERLTMAGLEVASIQPVGDWWEPQAIVVGQVMAVLAHPNADRLVLVDVDHGAAEPQRVVTGAPNLFQYRGAGSLPTLKVAFARTGAVLEDAYSDQRPRPRKALKPTKIRGVDSAGMVCSERELGLSEEHEGIMLLPDDAPVGVPLRDYLGDTILELDITPDMARCLNMIGVAREVAALTGAALHLPADPWQPSGDDRASDYVRVVIDEPALCNRYTGVLILDVQIGPSPLWMQTYLRKAGMRPINNVVDITNFVMLEWGQPLHAFDYDILVQRAQRAGGGQPAIIVRCAAEDEVFVTLDDVARTLDRSMLMIADTAGSVAIAGVMGGQESEVTPTTRNILLESATFEGINNRRTSQKLRLPSEASFRFARGVPATLNDIAAQRAADLMRQYAGGRIVPGIVDTYPVPQPAVTAYTTVSDMRRILGMDVDATQIADALQRLDFAVHTLDEPPAGAVEEATLGLHRTPGEPVIAADVPWHRLDVRMPADLAEEVARLIGYEHVGATLIDDEMSRQHWNGMIETEEKVRTTLVACGLQEIINHPLTTPANHDKLTPGRQFADPEQGYITLTNPSVVERRAMRRSLLVSALENLARNLRYAERLTTFEVGRVYLPEQGDGALPLEERRVSLLLAGPRQPTDFYTTDADRQEMDFFDLKGVIETLVDGLGFDLAGLELRAQPDTGTFGPRCAEVWLQGQYLGLMGEVHPQVRSGFGLPALRVCAAELALAPLVQPHWGLRPLQPISNYPAVVEDLAFEVAEDVTARQVQEIMAHAGRPMVVEVDLFDVYRGDPIPAGAKSLAYRVTYQSTERSLVEKEVAALRSQIIDAVERQTGGKLRG